MKLNNFLARLLLYVLPLFFSFNTLLAQDNAPAESFYQSALTNSIAGYHQAWVDQSALYNGSIYGEYLFAFRKGHPFFDSPVETKGTVDYDGITYDSVTMRYDEITDVLIVRGALGWIQLASEKITHFNLFNSNFIRLIKDSAGSDLISTGFYNLLYVGKITLLKKQVKSLREEVSSNIELEHLADERDYYFIKKDTRYYQVKNSRDMLKLFGDKKAEIKQFIRENNLSFSLERQNMLTKTTAYYDGLKK